MYVWLTSLTRESHISPPPFICFIANYLPIRKTLFLVIFLLPALITLVYCQRKNTAIVANKQSIGLSTGFNYPYEKNSIYPLRQVSQKDHKECVSNAIIGKKLLYIEHKHLFTHDNNELISNLQDHWSPAK